MVDTISLGKCFEVSYTDSGTVVKSTIVKPDNSITIWDIWAQYFSNITEAIEDTFEKFIPRPSYEVHKSETRGSKYVEHKITGY